MYRVRTTAIMPRNNIASLQAITFIPVTF